MFRRILIANRGEVAARVTRTCKRMGVQVVAVASEADRDHAWLNDADEVVLLGRAPAQYSYLDQNALIEVALRTGCAAVHPGWGFLAENDLFVTRCQAAGLTFIGPSANHMRAFGDKALARKTMTELGMPVIPGTEDPVTTLEQAREASKEVGYPLLLKAIAGGGGKGMRRVYDPADFDAAFSEASNEARSAFGDDRIYLERLIEGGRHVEVQVIADRYGNCVHLGERECSLQRRHQKVLEEARSPGLTQEERDRVLPLVADVVRRSGYVNAGTVEMLLDKDGKLWFMEMNTRLQVEHPVTELLTGVDLVELQLRVAANERLPITQADVSWTGHSLECRINAEDPDQDFKPSPGRVTTLAFPSGDGVRVDTHLKSGDRIPPNYDSMVAKLLVHGTDRADAIAKMKRALAGTVVEGVTTNIGLHQKILEWDAFTSGQYDTTSLERWMEAGQ